MLSALCFIGSHCGMLVFFKCGRTNIDDVECSDYPIEQITPEDIRKVHKIILAKSKVMLNAIVATIMIRKRVHLILYEHLSMRKLFSTWVLRLIPVNDSEHSLALFNPNKNFFMRYGMMNETLLHHFTTESRQSVSWMDRSRRTLFKTTKSASQLARLWRLQFGMRR